MFTPHKITVTAPASELAPVAQIAIEGFNAIHQDNWNAFIKKKMAKQKLGPFTWKLKSREEMEMAHGKPAEGKTSNWKTPYRRIMNQTLQHISYLNIIVLNINDPDKEITMDIAEYNLLMTFKE